MTEAERVQFGKALQIQDKCKVDPKYLTELEDEGGAELKAS
jgi:hypothetical protein